MAATAATAAIAGCREVLARKSKSFDLASRLLPARCRDEIAVIYAWCRRVDDAIDLAPRAERASALARLRRELDDVYSGRPLDAPTVRAFAEVARARGIPRRYPQELLAGMEMDVARTRYRSLDDLYLYCFRVAGVVGLMLCHVMGVRDPSALPRAAHLGIAMQLTNVCRDVAEDLDDGRVYLPGDRLGLDLASAAGDRPEVRAAVPRAVERLLVEADRFYRSADVAIPELPFRCALAVRAARLIYAAIGDALRRRRHDPLPGRVVVPTSTKIALVARALGQAVLEIPARLFRPRPAVAPDRVLDFPHDVLPHRAPALAPVALDRSASV